MPVRDLLDPIDKKWLDALDGVYPVLGAALPYYENFDGSVNAQHTLESFFRLIGAKLGPDGRILEPYGPA